MPPALVPEISTVPSVSRADASAACASASLSPARFGTVVVVGGGLVTLTLRVATPVAPSEPVTVSVMVKDPAAGYTAVAVEPLAVSPLPKSQR